MKIGKIQTFELVLVTSNGYRFRCHVTLTHTSLFCKISIDA